MMNQRSRIFRTVTRRQFFKQTTALSLSSMALPNVARVGAQKSVPGESLENAFAAARRSARIAGYSISKVQRWFHEKALPKIDPATGLYRADGKWNYRDTAADCYPFLCWAAHLVDPQALYGPVLDVLEAEQRLCNHIGRIPVRYDWEKQAKDETVGYDRYVFGASEYVKDGLIAIVEITGKGPWFERMKGIQEDLWERARVETPFGKIPSTNVEVNGEQIQALVRLFRMTSDERFLTWAIRLGDYYAAKPDYVPERLRDHGCEIIGGLGLLLGVLSETGSAKADKYSDWLKRMLDTILKRGTNDDGLMYNRLGDPKSGLSDGWGYNYVTYLCHDLVTGKNRYRPHVKSVLANLRKPEYRDYRWEGDSIDGYADSIEGGIYLLNRVPVAEGFAWVDRETANNVARSDEPLETAPLWGTMKLESNGVRTTIMHALMHTRGVIARPWREDLELGAAPTGDGGIAIFLQTRRPWQGKLEFDIPRHREFLGFNKDWPRMNTLPEWFVVEAERSYRLSTDDQTEIVSGQDLRKGYATDVRPDGPLELVVQSSSSV